MADQISIHLLLDRQSEMLNDAMADTAQLNYQNSVLSYRLGNVWALRLASN